MHKLLFALIPPPIPVGQTLSTALHPATLHVSALCDAEEPAQDLSASCGCSGCGGAVCGKDPAPSPHGIQVRCSSHSLGISTRGAYGHLVKPSMHVAKPSKM